MKKIRIIKDVTDKETKVRHKVGDVVEKSDERAKAFVPKYAEYVDAKDAKDAKDEDSQMTVAELKEHVATVESVDELKELVKGEERKGAIEAIESRIAELEDSEEK